MKIATFSISVNESVIQKVGNGMLLKIRFSEHSLTVHRALTQSVVAAESIKKYNV